MERINLIASILHQRKNVTKKSKKKDICIDCGNEADVRTTDTDVPFCNACYEEKHPTRSVKPIEKEVN